MLCGACAKPVCSVCSVNCGPRLTTSGPPSTCEPFRALILAQLERGLTARRIYQDLVREHGFTAQYHSVRRFVARLLRKTDLLVRRQEVEPGAEAQVDFGTGAPVKDETGKASFVARA